MPYLDEKYRHNAACFHAIANKYKDVYYLFSSEVVFIVIDCTSRERVPFTLVFPMYSRKICVCERKEKKKHWKNALGPFLCISRSGAHLVAQIHY